MRVRVSIILSETTMAFPSPVPALSVDSRISLPITDAHMHVQTLPLDHAPHTCTYVHSHSIMRHTHAHTNTPTRSCATYLPPSSRYMSGGQCPEYPRGPCRRCHAPSSLPECLDRSPDLADNQETCKAWGRGEE